MVFKWILFFNLCISGNFILLNPQKACIPTETVQGPCHLCVCDTHGIFICHSNKCENKTYVNPRISKKNECQSQMTYRYEELFCICSYENRWMSPNCRETFQFLKSNMNLIKQSMRSNTSCTPKSLFLIDCNICQCDSSGFIQPSSCTKRSCSQSNKAQRCNYGDVLRMKDEICICSDIGYYIDRLCMKVQEKTMQEVKDEDIAQISNIQRTRKAKNTETCIPHNEYTIDCNRCICDNNEKLVCTNKACEKQISHSGDLSHGFLNLPEITNKHKTCKPGKKYKIKCNTCICTLNKILSCTTILCLEDLNDTTLTTNLLTYIHY